MPKSKLGRKPVWTVAAGGETAQGTLVGAPRVPPGCHLVASGEHFVNGDVPKAALEEIGNHALFDYIVVNDDLEMAYDVLRSILQAERSRQCRLAPLAEEMIS